MFAFHRVLVAVVAASSMFAVSCKRDGAASEATAQAQPIQPELGKGTPAQNLVNAYLVVQTRLASDDFAGAKSAYASVLTAAKPAELAIDADLRKRVESAASGGGAAPDMPRARTAFAALSDALLAWFATATNPLAAPLVIAHCPMALDGKGSRWLQLGDKLRNPFFGSEMLTCGDIEKTVAPGKKP